MRRSRGRVVLAILFALLACNAWAQVLLVLLGRSNEPVALTVLQTLTGAAAAAAAWGSWAGTPWASAAAMLYGIITAGMLAALTPLLHLEAEARDGIWTGAAVVLLFGMLAGWYLRRAIGRDGGSPRIAD